MKPVNVAWTIILLIAGGYLAYRAATLHNGTIYVHDVDGREIVATAWEADLGVARPDVSRTIGVWVAAIFTLCIFSFLYRDNVFYKIAEAVVVGVSAAYWMVIGFWTVIVPNLLGKLFPAMTQSWAVPGLSPYREPFWYLYFIPLLLGIMLLWRLAPRGAWIARWPLAFTIGATAGMRLVAYIQADFLSQVRNTIRPLVAVVRESPEQSLLDGTASLDIANTVFNITLVVGVLSCLVYFFFSVEHKGAVGKVAHLGIWFLMITFGAAFGYTVMGRIALLAMRIEFLFDNWLWWIDPNHLRPPGWTGW